MQTSQYAQAVPLILADMEQGREEDEQRNAPPDPTPQPQRMHVYPAIDEEGNVGLLVTKTPLPPQEQEQEPHIVESGEFEIDRRPTTQKDPPHFWHVLLLLLLFVGLDSADTLVTALFSPTVTITILPQQAAITTNATFPIGAGRNAVQGRMLPVLTLSQSLSLAATGKGHQDARTATGTLTFYNGQFQSVTVSSGTVFTGRDSVRITITQDAVIPAADPSTNPPAFGQVTVSVQAAQPGAGGNIPAFDLSGSCCATSVIVKNLAPFANGQDARDFTYVTRQDIQQANEMLTPHLVQSERGALNAQLQPGETLTTPTCTPSSFSDHRPGDEVASVQVTVSETCRAVAYSQQSLQAAALQLIHARLTHLGTQYRRVGALQITVHSVAMQNGSATIAAAVHGVWVYQIDEEQIKALVAGKPRLQAIRLLQKLSGIQRVSIAGIADNQVLPDDTTHIRLLLIYAVF